MVKVSTGFKLFMLLFLSATVPKSCCGTECPCHGSKAELTWDSTLLSDREGTDLKTRWSSFMPNVGTCSSLGHRAKRDEAGWFELMHKPRPKVGKAKLLASRMKSPTKVETMIGKLYSTKYINGSVVSMKN